MLTFFFFFYILFILIQLSLKLKIYNDDFRELKRESKNKIQLEETKIKLSFLELRLLQNFLYLFFIRQDSTPDRAAYTI